MKKNFGINSLGYGEEITTQKHTAFVQQAKQ